jgi:hypothetical protein
MQTQFDKFEFCLELSSLGTQSRMSGYEWLDQKLKSLARKYRGLFRTSAPELDFVACAINRERFHSAIRFSRSFEEVSRLFRVAKKRGFKIPTIEVSGTVEFAEYCKRQNLAEVGLKHLDNVEYMLFELPVGAIPTKSETRRLFKLIRVSRKRLQQSV